MLVIVRSAWQMLTYHATCWVLRVGVVVTIIHRQWMVVVIGVIGVIVVGDGHISKTLCSGQFWTEPHRSTEPTA